MPAIRDRTPATWLERRCAPCFHHALLLQRAEARRCDDPTADPILAAVLTTLSAVQLDDEARALGLRGEHIAAVHFALAALLDESAAQTPGSEPWREHLFTRAALPRSASVGDEFFVDLERRLALPTPTPADLAVLQIHALCLLLGLRGRYGARIDADPGGRIGCCLIAEAHFFPPEAWVRRPADWSPRTQTGGSYDLTRGEGQRIWVECLERTLARPADDRLVARDAARYGAPVLHAPRRARRRGGRWHRV